MTTKKKALLTNLSYNQSYRNLLAYDFKKLLKFFILFEVPAERNWTGTLFFNFFKSCFPIQDIQEKKISEINKFFLNSIDIINRGSGQFYVKSDMKIYAREDDVRC